MNVNTFLKIFYLSLLYGKNSIALKFPKIIVWITLEEIVKLRNNEQIRPTWSKGN